MKYLRVLVAISLIASWIIVGYIVVGSRTQSTSPVATTTTTTDTAASNSTPTTTSTATTSTSTNTLTAANVATHNSQSDCYLIINSKVYNVTSYLQQHPGGVRTITPYCGKEATNAFDTKDQGQPHSSAAAQMLAAYLVGDLVK